ncbi:MULTISPECIES: hypothetical protein [Methylobacteriaceae]|uniref:hypothetical protein n=1 Tax=Methylobacteriaceae TaxID=119045 RepID=UPI001FE1CF15|nr:MULTISPECIES: hypothetical protein [Methylobacteriaceae]MCP1549422.1 hypothetical protein [Methylorubrum zatmanii]MCP1553965.1 hypothetical protein [Methylorubrum extorquens]MCP1579724.1 hypothetical protein [Methylorubrum extorquens]
MSAVSPIRAYEAMRGWWVTAVRALSFVLVLALVVPGAVPSAEAQRLPGTEASLSAYTAQATSGQPDGCPACHATCGCHLAVTPEGSAWLPSAATGRPSYATVDVALASISSGRLPRPPRA